jgi:hypothetical protein
MFYLFELVDDIRDVIEKHKRQATVVSLPYDLYQSWVHNFGPMMNIPVVQDTGYDNFGAPISIVHTVELQVEAVDSKWVRVGNRNRGHLVGPQKDYVC